jgi:hypothetical protein
MGKILKDLFTGRDNATYSLARVLWGLLVLVFAINSLNDLLVLHNHFDPQAFGIGVGSLMAGGGIALGQQAKTEPGVNS